MTEKVVPIQGFPYWGSQKFAYSSPPTLPLYRLLKLFQSEIGRPVAYHGWAKKKFFKIYNPAQNMWHKVKKSSKIGQDFKNLLLNFACFLTAIVKV